MYCSVHRQYTAAAGQPVELRKKWSKVTFNVSAMTDLLDGDNHDMLQQLRKFVSDPCMVPKHNIPLAEERQITLKRLARFCRGGFISVRDFWYVHPALEH